jgi:hypothetical protein
MKLFKSLILQTALVLAAAGAPLLAWAGPQYHVAIDTAGLAGQSGYLDFLFLGLDTAAPATASLSNFSGDFAPERIVFGDVGGDIGATVTIGNFDAYNEFAQWAHFGGVFGFDIAFDVAPGPGPGTTLSVALLDAAFDYLGSAGDIVTFSLQPGQDAGVSADGTLATVSEVPEPSSAWLGAAGLLLLGAMKRRPAGSRRS